MAASLPDGYQIENSITHRHVMCVWGVRHMPISSLTLDNADEDRAALAAGGRVVWYAIHWRQIWIFKEEA